MTLQGYLQPVTNSNNHLSGYDLTTLLIRGGLAKLGLNSNAKQVLLYLATCYNEKNGVVFPRVKTIAEAMDISERGVIRALAELTEKGCIIRSKRRKNSNEYIITKKVLGINAIDVTTVAHDDTFSSDTVTPLMIHEIKQHEVKQQQLKKADVVSLSNFSLKRVPDSIRAKKTDKNGQPIRSHEAYWNSFTNEQKRQYLEQEKAEAEEIRLKEERKKALELEKEKQKEEEARRRAELNKPLNEQFTREQAIKHVWQLRNIHRGNLKEGLTKSLAELYNLDVAYICTLSEEEARKLF